VHLSARLARFCAHVIREIMPASPEALLTGPSEPSGRGLCRLAGPRNVAVRRAESGESPTPDHRRVPSIRRQHRPAGSTRAIRVGVSRHEQDGPTEPPDGPRPGAVTTSCVPPGHSGTLRLTWKALANQRGHVAQARLARQAHRRMDSVPRASFPAACRSRQFRQHFRSGKWELRSKDERRGFCSIH
jgi:hypothetical protein